jgi:competence protein ComFC
MFLADILFPKRCLGCGKIGYYFCRKCVGSIKIIQKNEAICPVCERLAFDGITHPRCQGRYDLNGLTSFFRYDGVIKKSIKSIKYRFTSDIAREFIHLIPLTSYNLLPLSMFDNSILIPIPLHLLRFRHRGFNQAEILGFELSKILKISLCKDVLIRVKPTTPQVEMKNRIDRLKNMNEVFNINNLTTHLPSRQVQQPARIAMQSVTGRFNNINVFLLDDVFTTGATMRAAATILKKSGVKSVWGITMAR